MTTNAPTIRRLPRLSRTAAAIGVAVIVIAAGYQATESPQRQA